jgi:plasmid stabilization system protein ParE
VVTFVEDLPDLCPRIANHPNQVPARPDIAKTARMAIHGRYLILFESPPSETLIRRTVHGGRDLTDLF